MNRQVMKRLIGMTVVLSAELALAQSVETIKTIDPIRVRSDDGKVLSCQVSLGKVSVWQGRDVVQMSDVKVTGCQPGNYVFEKPITLMTDTGRRITIPANRTILYLSEKRAQVDVKNNHKGGVVSEVGEQKEASEKVYQDFSARKKQSAELIQQFQRAVVNQDYSVAREHYSKVVNANELYSDEILKIGTGFKAMPSDQRPLKTYDRDMRGEVESLKSTFSGTDFDKMTVGEYVAFVKNWADHPEKFTEKGDQTYLFRIAEQVGVSSEDRFDFFYRAYASRMARVRSQYSTEKSPDFNDVYVLGSSLRYMKYHPKGAEFFKALRANLAKIDPKEREYLAKEIFELEEYMPTSVQPTVSPAPGGIESGNGK